MIESRWVVLQNTAAVPDRYTAKVGRYHGWLNQPMPVLKITAIDRNLRCTTIPEELAYRLAEAVLQRGGTLGEPEAAVLGLRLKSVC